MKKEWWWISTNKMTIGVAIRDDKIVDGADIVKKFIGQNPKNLGRWMRKQGGFKCQKISRLLSIIAHTNSERRG